MKSLFRRLGRIATLGSIGGLLGLGVTMVFVGVGPTLSGFGTGLGAVGHEVGDRLAVARWESLPGLSLSSSEWDALWNAALVTAIDDDVLAPLPNKDAPIPLWSAQLNPTFVPQVPGHKFTLLTETEIQERAQAQGECAFVGVGRLGYSLSAVRVNVYSSARFRERVVYLGGGSVIMECGGWGDWKCTVVERWIS